jgi:transglutaminase superfamily protein
MSRLASVRRLSAAERRILALGWLLLVVAPLALRVLPLRRMLTPARPRSGPGLPPERVARLVEVAARAVPGAGCLPVAVVTAWLLARQGTRATLRIGVARHAGRLAAHAWLECDGVPLLHASQAEGYTPILAVAVP